MNDSQLLELFPFIRNSVELFDNQNRFLKKIILTGKISALEKAANLFSFTEKTIETFTDLKDELIPLLIQENVKKYTEELHSKAQISIDILIRNLFERTADVGFLATDNVIIEFLRADESAETLKKRLVEYTLKYSVYHEIIIADTQGKVALNINSSNIISDTAHDPIIEEALATDGYIERYAYSPLFSSQNKSLMFAQRIVENHQPMGVLILCFRFEDEMERIFSSLLSPSEHVYITDGKQIIATSESSGGEIKKPKKSNDKITFENGNLFVSASTKGYEGYFGSPSWKSVSYMNARKSSQKPPVEDTIGVKCTLDENIKSIIRKADDVIEDLSDVIINGELIASKERVYVLTPVLDNLRSVSSAILTTIKETVNNLENTIMEGLIYDAQSAAKLAIEIMDRNLYERANDCRWWAMTPLFEYELGDATSDTKRMNDVLSYINNLYTVYTNLFIYNRDAIIVASSNDQGIIGNKISGDYISRTLSNQNGQNYFVSAFEPTPYYQNEATYIYSATIRHNEKIVGGIGIVFDSYPQFLAMLQDSFPAGKKGFSCFLDRKGTVIATTHPTMQPMDHMELEEAILRYNDRQSTHRFLTYEGKKYLVGIALSYGYREYKLQDNYKNDILSLTFIEY